MSRAKRKRERAEAALLREETRQLKDERRRETIARREEQAGANPWMQPTVRGLVRGLRGKIGKDDND